MTALPMFVDHLKERAATRATLGRMVVVSPDAGRAKLANHFAERLGATLAVLTKQRPDHNEAEITFLIGDVAGCTAILIDDMIDTAGTLCAGAKVVKERGRRAGAGRRHPRAAVGPRGRAPARVGIEQVLLTDTVPLPEEAADLDLFRVLSVNRILADSVHNVFCDESVSAIFAGENQLF